MSGDSELVERPFTADKKDYPYDSREIANWFIRRGLDENQPLSLLKLIKLIYIAHGWSLAIREKPLIIDRIEAWERGPVVPPVYYAFRPFGVKQTATFGMNEAGIDAETQDLLSAIYGNYKDLTGQQLSELTHLPGSPWARIIQTKGRFAEIPHELISQHYKELME
ncbi:MAG: DUF4065 domain-containing protein [Rhodobacteraceae bacterium]|nr:DUF4065 domain-containing protein [Paracoccaceae bacterium]